MTQGGFGDLPYAQRHESYNWSPTGAAEASAAGQAGVAEINARAQREAARMGSETARRQAELQYNASIFPEQQKQQRFNTLSSMLFGGGMPGGGRGAAGGMNSFGAPGGGRVGIPTPVGGGGLFGGGSLFGGGGPQGVAPGGEVDRTLPTFSSDPFSRSRLNQEIQSSGAQNARQMATEARNIEESGARSGYAAGSGQTLARQDAARQRGLSGGMTDVRNLRNQFATGGAGLEMGRQGLLEQSRRGIGKEDVARRTVSFGPDSDRNILLKGLVGALGA